MSPSPRRRGGMLSRSDSSRRRRISIPLAQAYLDSLNQPAAPTLRPEPASRPAFEPQPVVIHKQVVMQTQTVRETVTVPPRVATPSEQLRAYLENGGDITLRTVPRSKRRGEILDEVDIRPASSMLETIFARPAKGRRWPSDPSAQAAPFVGELSGFNAIRELLHREDPVIWMFVGDDANLSLTKGKSDPASYHRMFADRLRQELYRSDDLALAEGGTKASVLDHLKRWPKTRRKFQPNVLFYMPTQADFELFGPSPQTYLNGVREFLDAIRLHDVQPIVQTTWLLPRKHEYHRLSYALAEDLRLLAAEFDLPLIDHHHRWEMANRTINTERWLDHKKFTPDHVGQIALAMEIFHELDLFEQRSLICNQERLLIC
ncbi:SGNH/GDSL hydrolase family protein [Lacunimicrobium album]